MSESIEISTIERVQQVARACQGPTAQRVAHLFRERDGAKRFKAGWELVEALMIEVLDRLNSALVADGSASALPLKLRRHTFGVAEQEKKPAFGERSAALSVYASAFRSREGLRFEPFVEAQAVLREPLDVEAAQMVRWLVAARIGRKKFEIPPGHIDAYTREHVPTEKGEKRYFVDLLTEFVQWRNADSHVDRESDSDKRWLQQLTANATWWELVGARMEQGLSGLLLWSPITRMLTRSHRYRLRDYRRVSADGWSAHLIEPSAVEFIPRVASGVGTAVVADQDEWWIEFGSLPGEPRRARCPCVNWPTTPSPFPSAELDHRSRVAKKLLEVGYLGDDHQRALAESARIELLPKGRALALQVEVCDVVARASAGEAEATARLVNWVGATEVDAHPPDGIAARRDAAILAHLENQWPITRDELAEAVGIVPEELDAILGSPTVAPRVHRSKAEGGTESLRPNWEELDEARAALSAARHHKKASELERRLADCLFRLGRLLDDGFASADGETELEPEVRASVPVTLRLDAKVLTAETVPGLLAAFLRWAEEAGHWAKLAASLPWFTDDGQQLLGVRGVAAVGPQSAAPAGVADVLIAKDPRRALALYTLEQECAHRGWMSPPRSLDLDTDNDPLREYRLSLDVRAHDVHPWDRVGGDSVREFLTRLLRWVVEESARFDSKRLPVASGRSRYILNSEPIHASGKPFLEPIRVSPGLYVEGHQSYASALSAAQKLCAAFWVGLREDGVDAMDAGPVRRKAEAAGVAEAFGILFDAGLRMGLAPRYYSRSVMFAPAANLTRFAFFLRPQPRRQAGVLEVSWSPEAFAEFLGIAPERAAQFMGETRQEIVDAEGAQRLADRLGKMMAGEVEAADEGIGQAAGSGGLAPRDRSAEFGDAVGDALRG